MIFLCSPLFWGRWTHFDSYFSDRSKPPTRNGTKGRIKTNSVQSRVFLAINCLNQHLKKHTLMEACCLSQFSLYPQQFTHRQSNLKVVFVPHWGDECTAYGCLEDHTFTSSFIPKKAKTCQLPRWFPTFCLYPLQNLRKWSNVRIIFANWVGCNHQLEKNTAAWATRQVSLAALSVREGGGSHQPAYVIHVEKFGENKYHPGGTMVYLELL